MYYIEPPQQCDSDCDDANLDYQEPGLAIVPVSSTYSPQQQEQDDALLNSFDL